MQQVTQDDALPKVVCHDCWSQIETFHSFVQRVIAVREDYLQQQLNDCVKEEEVPDGMFCFTLKMDYSKYILLPLLIYSKIFIEIRVVF
ncbi:MAG: hypothetical protein EOP04_32065 [Proteobacteria bacterium]|nr:MAG: hypothetical protein EOP04_32065 [Pseudomonadota bacterium]